MDRTPPASSPVLSDQKRRPGRIVLIVIVVLIVLAIIWALMRGSGHHKKVHTPDATQPVAVETVKTGDMPVELTELGTVIPITNVTVQTRISGYLTEVNFTEGQTVKAGDQLALIDPRPYEVLLAQYEGQLKQDEAKLASARVDNDRYQKLIKQNSVSAMTARDQQYTVMQLEGTVKSDQALIDNEKLQIIYCHILAPTDGRIGIRAVDRGNYISAGQTNGLATLTQMEPISVIFTLPQQQLGQVATRLREVGSLPVSAWDSSNTTQIAEGATSVLDSQIDTATGTVRLRAIFPNEDHRLFPNQFVNAHLLVNTLHDAIIVPTNALQTGPSGQFVYVVKADDTVTARSVKPGISNGDSTVVESGLNIGDRVVTDGTDHLREGLKVTIPADDTSDQAGKHSTSEAGGKQ
ncbi:MAG: efflux RND transporter periplasmic adaptor subunit [Acetobacter sp.]|nr:efflux RND transporter periplasmic adaptor subunit [Acetobacter sp.]